MDMVVVLLILVVGAVVVGSARASGLVAVGEQDRRERVRALVGR
jgi:hypothetical protein